MRYTLGSYFSIGFIQPGTIARSVKLDVAFAAKTRGRNACARKKERKKRERKQIVIGKKMFIRASEKESVGFSGNRAANFVDGFIGDGAAVTKRDGAREGRKGVTSSVVGVIK